MSLRIEDLKPGMILRRPDSEFEHEAIFYVKKTDQWFAYGYQMVLDRGELRRVVMDLSISVLVGDYSIIYAPTPEAA